MLKTFNINDNLKTFNFNKISIPFHTSFTDFKILLNLANITFQNLGDTLSIDIFQEFDQQLKILKKRPEKKLNPKHSVKIILNRIYLVIKVNLNIKTQFNFNHQGLISSITFELRDLDEDYSSWENYDIDRCHKLHLDWLQQSVHSSSKISPTLDLKHISGNLIRDKSENIFWSLKIKQAKY